MKFDTRTFCSCVISFAYKLQFIIECLKRFAADPFSALYESVLYIVKETLPKVLLSIYL